MIQRFVAIEEGNESDELFEVARFRPQVLDFELRRADGQSLVAQQAFNTIATASRRRNREFFLYVTYSFSGLEPGDYVVRTTVRDRVGAKQTAFDLAFAVRR